FHWAFVTAGTTLATSTDIAYYNQFVTDQAGQPGALTEGLGINWFAVGSTQSVNAKDNVPVTIYPVFLLDGTRIADDASDLWDQSIQAPWDVDQSCAHKVGTGDDALVWTGTHYSGTAALMGSRALGIGGATMTGSWEMTNMDWVNYENRSAIDDEPLDKPMYAISEVQTVQTVVPVPAAAWLLGSGIIGLVVVRRRSTK
ncbi:MAG: VPLPA-CTERM sorting domain-containing protein, partial [Thermodesulfobacteriota bacterium]|nr:VPLPA-CTERM sorting domain-containing protein [Thermodesulfobacteriota bacterium]